MGKGSIRFGPAGLGGVKDAEETLAEYHRLGLTACEVAFTYSVYMNKRDAVIIGEKARALGIALSIHAPYFVNLNSEDVGKREATRRRILACCEIGEELGASVVVFHPGYYGKDKEESYTTIRDGIFQIMKDIRARRLRIEIAPETMGKVNVFGSVEEISRLVLDTGCSFCIDFAHILARDKRVDYEKVKRLFPQKEWHVHFSGIIYGEKGEKSHRVTEKREWKELLENLPRDRTIRVINESPSMVEDSVIGLALYEAMR